MGFLFFGLQRKKKKTSKGIPNVTDCWRINAGEAENCCVTKRVERFPERGRRMLPGQEE